MTIGFATGRSRAFKTLALWLGLIALTIQAMAPLCLPAQAASGGSTITICTSHGIETIALDADGKPVKSTPTSGHHNTDCSLCSACPMGGGFTAPSVLAFATSLSSADAARIVLAAPAPPRPPHFFYVGRAPPRIAKTDLA